MFFFIMLLVIRVKFFVFVYVVFCMINVVVFIVYWVSNNFDLLYQDIFDNGLLVIFLVSMILLVLFIVMFGELIICGLFKYNIYIRICYKRIVKKDINSFRIK